MSGRHLTLTRLTLANIGFRPLAALFSVLLLASGIAIILTLVHLNSQIERRFYKDLQGIDLVASGKGSPLQIILSSVFQLDIPTGNIPLAEAEKLKTNPLVKATIPIALGDNYNGYRIVGTNADYIAHYDGQFAAGRMYAQPMETVLGSDVAATFHLKLGDQIVGAHGLVNSDDLHSDFPYTVVGILKPQGGVLDRLVLTPVESVWHVHEHPDPDDPEEAAYKHEHPENEITALLITYRSPYAAATLPRLINKTTSMQGASPAFEIARLNKLMGTGSDALSAFGALLIGFAAFGLFVTLYNSVNDRRYDIALMRCLGATRARIFAFIMAEVMTLAVSGCVLGLVFTELFLALMAAWIRQTRHVVLEPAKLTELDGIVVAAVLGISFLAGIIPAIRAYKVNIAKVLTAA